MSYKLPKLSGDITGDPSSNQAAGLLTHTLPALSDGYLNWNGSSWVFSTIGSGFVAAGDLTGNSSSQTIAKIQGNTVNAASLTSVDDGYALTWVNASAQWQPRPTSIVNGFGAYSARPSPGHAGKTFIASDGIITFVDDGYEWRPMIQGVPGWEVAPANSIAAFTQIGSAPLTTNVQGGCFYFSSDGYEICGYEVSKSAVQEVTAHIIPLQFPQGTSPTSNTGSSALYVRDSSSGKLEGIFIGKSSNADNYNYVQIAKFSALNVLDGYTTDGGLFLPFSHGVWLRIIDDGSKNVFYWSFDGQNWNEIGQDTYIPSQGNKFGFCLSSNGLNAAMTVQSFNVQSAVAAPTFSLATPNVGSAAGGWTTTLTGSGFTGASGVMIGGQPCTSVVVVNDTTITCIAPAFSTPNGSSSASPIIITAPGGTISSSGIPTNYYYYPSNQTLRAAYRGDVGTHVTTGIIIQWDDLSGNGNNLTRYASEQGPAPATVNGLGAALFAPGNGMNVGASPGFTSGFATICAVASANSYPSAGGNVAYLNASSFQMGFSAINVSTPAWCLTDALTTNLGLSVGPYNTGQLYSVAALNNGPTNSARYVNNDDTGATGSQGALTAISNFLVGVDPAASNWFDGTICEVLLYEGACSSGDIATIYNIQKTVWNIP